MILKTLLSVCTLFVSASVFAQALPVQGGTPEILKAIAEHNVQQAKLDQEQKLLGPIGGARSTDVLAPFYEYDKTGYVVFSDDDFYGIARDMKMTIAKNLPAETHLIVYTQSTNKSYHKQLVGEYSQYIDSSRLHVLQIPQSGSNDFWSRDNLPLPIWKNGKLALADARYYYNFEPDAFFGQLFGVDVMKHNYFYEGGNFMANGRGDCLAVMRKKAYPGGVSDTAAIPDDVFKNIYGCKTLTRLKHLKGIGHADEVVKFMSDTVVVTDTQEYVATLEKAGFTVYMLPEAKVDYETYANSLIVNDVVFVPTFSESGDQKAVDLYTKLGFKVVTIPTGELAVQGQGGIHCITMNYPPIPFQNIVSAMNAKVIQ
ncbi:MAG: agmatine deiminase family protein [Bdellovibrionaceae bacterium]|nr:agmatine deiminase family protein [Pseudobdellovibrionaceae bacterium]